MCAAKSKSNTSVAMSVKSDSVKHVATNLSVTGDIVETAEDDAVSMSSLTSVVGVNTSLRRMLSPTRLVHEDDEPHTVMELPSDFRILPVYYDILEEPLPPMEIFPVFRLEKDHIEEIVKKMDNRLRRNHSYKAFIEETKNLLTYALQEIKLRKVLQSQLAQREVEMQNFQEKYKRDPRIYKMIMLADHWRTEKDHSDEKIQSLLMEINALTMDLKILENKLASVQKRQDKMEAQIQKSKTCEQEKERLEEQIMVREKALVDITETVENLKTTVTMIQAEALNNEIEFQAKLQTAPDRNAMKLAVLTRELELMGMEKEHKIQEAREMHEHVNALIVENARTVDRVKVLMDSIRGLKNQLRSLEAQHKAVVSQNKGLSRLLNTCSASVKVGVLDTKQQAKENSVLKINLEAVQKRLKMEECRFTTSLHKISRLEGENKRLLEELDEKKFTIKILEEDAAEAHKDAQTSESHFMSAARMHQNESQRAKELHRKLAVSGRHIRIALNSINSMNEMIDKTGERLRILDVDLVRCQEENVRNQSTITHLHRILENTENMVRLQTRENDALVICKKKLVDSLKTCFNFRTRLSYDVSRLQSIKTSMEDSALTHKFMLDFVENERDGAVRNAQSYEDAIVMLQRKQVIRITQMARANSEASRLRLKVEEVQHQLNSQKREVINLTWMLKMSESASKHVEAAYKTLVQQRDLFGNRILQQNTEAELARMKMETMMRVIDKGNTNYRDRCNDILVLKKEVQNLRRRVKGLENTESLCQELKTEVALLSKNVCLEMNKRAAIERVKIPNIHPHRELQSNHPSFYEMILKIQKLQKNLISKTQESIIKERELAIKNDTIKQLRMAVSRRDIEKNKKNWIKSVVVTKNHKIKSLMAEVNMLNYQLNISTKAKEEQRQELSTVKNQLMKLKRAKSAKESSTKPVQVSQELGKKSSIQSAFSFRPGRQRSGSDTSLTQ